MKFLVFGLLCFVAYSEGAFNVNNFVKTYCVESKDSIVCRNFQWNAADLNDIQRTYFTISNAPKVEFINAVIGTLNENLINKFPNAVEFHTNGCTVRLNSTTSVISSTNYKLQKLIIERGFIYGNNRSTALGMLNALKYFEIDIPQYVESTVFDEVLLSKNSQLTTVNITGANFDLLMPKAFANLKQLNTLKFEFTNIANISADLVKGNTNLKVLSFANNRIRTIPTNGIFPSSLESLNFGNNYIQMLNNKEFVGLNKLKVLNLMANQISVLSADAFINTPALETLDLSFNNIKKLEKKHFVQLKLLKNINLYENKLENLPNDLFDDLINLQDVIVNGF